MAGFKKFLLRGNLVDLAVAVLIATAFGALVVALTKDFITPLLAAIGGKPDFSTLCFKVNGSKFLYGDFINAVIAFVILAAILYFFVSCRSASCSTVTSRPPTTLRPYRTARTASPRSRRRASARSAPVTWPKSG